MESLVGVDERASMFVSGHRRGLAITQVLAGQTDGVVSMPQRVSPATNVIGLGVGLHINRAVQGILLDYSM